MDKDLLPKWSCNLVREKDVEWTVGSLIIMKCKGIDAVPAQKKYDLDLSEKDAYALKILKVTKDTENAKDFLITSYKAGQSGVPFKLLGESGQELFQSFASGLTIKSLIKNPQNAKPSPPKGQMLLLPTGLELVSYIALFFALAALLIRRQMRKFELLKDYKRVLMDVKYDDPFMDLNIDLRNLKEDKRKTKNFKDSMDQKFKKFFFRIAQENLFLNKNSRLRQKLQAHKVPAHEIRSVLILLSDYKTFNKSFLSLSEPDYMKRKAELLEQAKKTLSPLKRYIKDWA